MTVTVDLPMPDPMPGGERLYGMYQTWCYKNLFMPGEPKTWAFFDYSYGNAKYAAKKVIFYNEEDAMAFKLRFGL